MQKPRGAHNSGREFIGKKVAKYFNDEKWVIGRVLDVVKSEDGTAMSFKVAFPQGQGGAYHETMSGAEVGQAIEVAKLKT